MNKLLSICVAAYNAERTITRMLDSLLRCQNRELLDIIVVNDGSSDKTSEVVSSIIDKGNSDVVKLINKENGGSGSARNVAFREATGKYIKIIDADDWVITDEFDKYLKILKKYDVDVVWNGYYTQHGDDENLVENNMFHGLIEKEKEIRLDTNATINLPKKFFMHGITYNRSIIKENDIRLSEGMSYVDLEYSALPVPYLKTALYIDHSFYVYRLGLAGQSMDPQVSVKKLSNKKRIAKRLLDYYDEQNKLTENQKYVINRVTAIACQSIYDVYYVKADYSLRKELMEIDRNIKDQNIKVWEYIPEISGSAKLFRICNYWGYYPMVFINKIRNGGYQL